MADAASLGSDTGSIRLSSLSHIFAELVQNQQNRANAVKSVVDTS